MNTSIIIEEHVVTVEQYAASSPEGRKKLFQQTQDRWMTATAWEYGVWEEAGRRVRVIMAAEFEATPQYLPRPLTKSGRPSTRPSPTNPAFSDLCDRRREMERDMFDVVKSERGIPPMKSNLTHYSQISTVIEGWDRALKNAASVNV